MNSFNHRKYRSFESIPLERRAWPDRKIKHAPLWCSVDLRDGNQALIEPMGVKEKLRLFQLLIEIGFKEIEVGFPAASRADYQFVRHIIEHDLVPSDIRIQVLTQARSEIIARTFAAVEGANKVTLHVYNSTSTVQRRKVFQMSRAEIVSIATNAATDILGHSKNHPDTDWRFQYSPESFTGTEVDFSVEVVDAVSAIWQPTPEKPMQVALPSTVEMSSPNIYADQIEWFCRNIENRQSIIVSTHTHNDRGCAVAAAELGVMAGAQRVEGTLLGNGERTGHMDIITMSMNLYSQGIDPKLNFSNMDRIVKLVSECIQMNVNPRHPYCGDLVFTAFSGGHQDAINKCLEKYKEGNIWDVAYLPIDPKDIGRSYQNIIRINSQSGKGGICYAIKSKTSVHLPYWLQIEFSQHIQRHCDGTQGEITHDEIWTQFRSLYLSPPSFFELVDVQPGDSSCAKSDKQHVHLKCDGEDIECSAKDVVPKLLEMLGDRMGVKFTMLESECCVSDRSGEYFSHVMLDSCLGRSFGLAMGRGRLNQLVAALVKAADNIYSLSSESPRLFAAATVA